MCGANARADPVEAQTSTAIALTEGFRTHGVGRGNAPHRLPSKSGDEDLRRPKLHAGVSSCRGMFDSRENVMPWFVTSSTDPFHCLRGFLAARAGRHPVGHHALLR